MRPIELGATTDTAFLRTLKLRLSQFLSEPSDPENDHFCAPDERFAPGPLFEHYELGPNPGTTGQIVYVG